MNIDKASRREGCARAAVNAFERSCRIYYRYPYLPVHHTVHACIRGSTHERGVRAYTNIDDTSQDAGKGVTERADPEVSWHHG